MLQLDHPVALAMWDFSWLERRWSGAGYEDWGLALDALLERGYDAVRIDAFPHFVGRDPHAHRDLVPVWRINDWGAPAPVTVRPWPALAEFVAKCRERRIRVGLSTWFRQDHDDVRRQIDSPQAHAGLWIRTVELLEREGLGDTILYVDLCNEFPGNLWAPFFKQPAGVSSWNADTDEAFAWMSEAVTAFRTAKPGYPVSFSYSFQGSPAGERAQEVRAFDFLDPHIWLVQTGGFLERIEHKGDVFDLRTWDNIVARAEPLYRSEREQWLERLRERILAWAAFSRQTGRPLVTTECWGIVDYRDWPGLDWGWVKEACVVGTETAAATGRWVGIATSNFCGPQFAGMWRDVDWHQRLTRLIKAAPIAPDLTAHAKA